MLKRLRSLLLIAIGAIAGAVCGRIFAQMRAARLDPDAAAPLAEHGIRLRPQELVPGVVAALRVGEAPWSWLHVPGWLAAFAVNFAAAALAGDLGRLREMFEAGGISLNDSWVEPAHDAQWTVAEDPPPTATV